MREKYIDSAKCDYGYKVERIKDDGEWCISLKV